MNWTGRLGQARYRVGQFLSGWRAALSPQDHGLVAQVLSPVGPAALELFARMPVDAQAHSIRVLKAVGAGGATPPDLAVAALLHDVGKVASSDAGAYLGLWMRGPLVLLEAWRPELLARLASPQPSAGLRYALYVHSRHPQIGAAWAQQAGCSPLTCWLIAHHQDKTAAKVGTEAGTEAGTFAAGAVAEPLVGSTPVTVFDLTTARHNLARLQWADGRN
jgi:hypothetical protein